MTILLVGAGGQVGREVSQRLGPDDLALDHHGLDITDPVAVEATLRDHPPRVVINAAAYTAVDRAEQEPDRAEALNVQGPANLAAACRKHHAALLHLSTDYVFDGTKKTPYVETDTPNPQGIYARTKWQGEQRVREILEEHLILRVSWVFGAHGHNFVKTILRLAKERDELRIVADQHGAPTPASGIAETLIKLAQRIERGQALPWGTYHYAGTPDTTWYGFASEIVDRGRAAGLLERAIPVHPIATVEYPTPAPRPANSRLDCARIETEFKLHRPQWSHALDDVIMDLNRPPAARNP